MTGLRGLDPSDEVSSSEPLNSSTLKTRNSKQEHNRQSAIDKSAIVFGAEGEIRTLEASLEDSNVSSYITSANRLPISNCRLPIVFLF